MVCVKWTQELLSGRKPLCTGKWQNSHVEDSFPSMGDKGLLCSPGSTGITHGTLQGFWATTFPGLLTLFAEQLSKETDLQHLTKLILSCAVMQPFRRRFGSDLDHLEAFSVIYHGIVSTFKWVNEYEDTFKVIKCQFYNKSKGIIIMIIKPFCYFLLD